MPVAVGVGELLPELHTRGGVTTPGALVRVANEEVYIQKHFVGI